MELRSRDRAAERGTCQYEYTSVERVLADILDEEVEMASGTRSDAAGYGSV